MTKEVPQPPLTDEGLGGGERQDGDGATSTTEADDDTKSGGDVGAESPKDGCRAEDTVMVKVSKLNLRLGSVSLFVCASCMFCFHLH